ncbi:MAG: hypothetical protein OEO84_04510 [Betaproteobacteria bacterium]|nr:hypothetical protein [Betaproteobacteria bacterium]
MKRLIAALLAAAAPALALAQDTAQTRELLGQLGGRAALMRLYAMPRADGSARLTGEYLILPTLQQRYLEGERSKQLGVTFLKEGNSPILYGRPASATLQGTWSGGVFKGMRFAPGGQERERFEFSEKFPDMGGYGAEVRCELAEGRYASSLEYAVAQGRLKRLDWRSRVAPGGHTCLLTNLEQQPLAGGLRFVAGSCRVTLRDLGEYVRVSAENCSEFCGSQAYLEPVLVARNGACQLLRPQQR